VGFVHFSYLKVLDQFVHVLLNLVAATLLTYIALSLLVSNINGCGLMYAPR
jgi:hypothetical protein